MKRYRFLLVTIMVGWASSTMCQTDEEKRAMEHQARLQHASQNDAMFNYVTGQGAYEDLYGPRKSVNVDEVNRKIREQTERNERIARQYQTAVQSGGIRLEVDNSSNRMQNDNVVSQRRYQEQAKRKRDESSRQALLAQREAAAELERVRKEQERIRKEIERQRIYNEAVREGYKRTEQRYSHLHNRVDYQATEGFDRMMQAQPKGTERIQSGYIPLASTVSPSDIVSVIQRKPRYGNTIVLIGTETSSLGQDWHSDDFVFNEFLSRQRIAESSENFNEESRKRNSSWHNLKEKMDKGQVAAMEFLMKENNGGVLPEVLGVTESGRIIFETDDGSKIFSVSANGKHLQVATLDEKHWSDDNIIKTIKEEGGLWNTWVKTVQDKTLEYKGGTVKFKDLNKLDSNALKQLLPQIKMELKMNVVDNSSTIQYKYYYLKQEEKAVGDMGELIGAPIDVNVVVGGRAKLSAGGKLGAKMELNATPSVARDDNTPFFNAKAEAKTADAEAAITFGYVVRWGDRYYMTRGEVTGNAGLGAKAEAKLDIKQRKGRYGIKALFGVSIGGAIFQDITPSVKD